MTAGVTGPPAGAQGLPPLGFTRVRRTTFFSFVGLGTFIGSWLLYVFLSEHGLRASEIALLAVFVPLYYQLNAGFWTALMGVWLMNRPKDDPLDLWKTLSPDDHREPLAATTAIIMPIYNEDVTRVFEGVRSMFLSLKETGQIEHFDFFILSDSDDTNKWIEEEVAWLELCRQLDAFGKIFYRKRRKPINRKSGNVSDFCRRWGKRYRYMVTLDADSLMSGALIAAMARIMEKNPAIGILQTFPKQVGAETLLGRVMQFVQSLYGPAFMAGLDYWQCGEANYWGHNAIIRLAPFIENCALPPLPGKEPFGGHILSHDFVESALMRRAGYAVRLLRTTHGSYEEGPPTLIDMLKRDRRWCQGNMQHFWLLFAKGWHPVSRLNFFHGILSYASSVLWFAFLILATFLAATPLVHEKKQAVLAEEILLGLTAMLIFLPKITILLDELFTSRLFKAARLRFLTFLSSLLDTVIFTLMAPVLMVFHARFVVYTIIGKGIHWAPQRRKLETGIDWSESLVTFGSVTALGLIWTVIAGLVSSTFVVWISPILISLVLAIPVGMAVSGRRSGRRFGLFVTPEEIDKPAVLRQLEQNLGEVEERLHQHPEIEHNYGLVQVCLDPYVNGLHVSLLRRRKNIHVSGEYLTAIARRFLQEGPQALKPHEVKSIIHDTDTVTNLHYRLWSAADSELAPFWLLAIKQYNLAATNPFARLLAQAQS